MKIGVISDTHDDVECTKLAIGLFKKMSVDLVVHLGDYVSPPILRLFKDVKLIGIFANNDGYKFVLAKAFAEIGGEIKGDFGVIEIDNLKVALYHGELNEISESLAKSGDYDAVFSGHWHKSSTRKIGKTLWISMGSAKREFAEKNDPVAGVFETETNKFEFIHIG